MDEQKSESIFIEDVTTGERTEMTVAATLSHNGSDYILVYEAESDPDADAEAIVLKVASETDEDIYYENVTDADELRDVAALFTAMDGEFTIEM